MKEILYHLKKYVVAVVLLTCSLALSGQKFVFEKIYSGNFNENITVFDIEQDTFGFLWLGTNTGLYKYDGNAFHSFEGVGKDVNSVCLDANNVLWVASNIGIFKISSSRDQVKFVPQSGEYARIYSLESNEENQIFFLTKESGLSTIDENDELVVLDNPFQWNSIYPNAFINLEIDEGQNIWVKDEKRIHKFDSKGKHLDQYLLSKDCNDFVVDSKGGKIIYVHHENDQIFSSTWDDPRNLLSQVETKSKSSGIRSKVFLDKEGMVWASFSGSIVYYNTVSNQITDLSDLVQEHGNNHTFVFSFCQVGPDKMFVGTNTGLYVLRVIHPFYSVIDSEDFQLGETKKELVSVRSIHNTKEALYVGTYSGLFKYSKEDKRITEIKLRSKYKEIYGNPLAYDIFPIGESKVLIGSESNGLLKMDTANDEIEFMISEQEDLMLKGGKVPRYLYCVEELGSDILMGTVNGLYVFSEGEFRKLMSNDIYFNKAKVFTICKSGHKVYLGTNIGLYEYINGEVIKSELLKDRNYAINYILIQDHIIWLGTRGDGLIHINSKTARTHTFGLEDGMSDLNVNSIFPYENSLWLSSNYGLSNLDTSTLAFKHYFIQDELPWTEFNHNASAIDDDGNFYFGGIGGVVYFNPRDIQIMQDVPSLRLSKLNQRSHKERRNITTVFGVEKSSTISLGPNDHFFAIEFTKSDLEPSVGDSYKYRLSGQEWVELGNSHSIQFTGLASGDYDLEIAGMDSYGNEVHPLKLKITIDQLIYKRWYAFMIYALVLLGLMYWAFQNIVARSELRNKLNLEQKYNRQLHDLSEAKSRFLSNIAHEFKTPLTLIQGPANQIEYVSKDPKIKQWSTTIQRNSKILMEMIQELLKLSRLDEGKYEIKWTDGNVMGVITDVFNSFSVIAEEKEVKMELSCEPEALYCRYDEDKIRHILRNLISNAIKFNRNGGSVILNANQKYDASKDSFFLNMIVKDTGIGVPKEKQSEVFKRFYQADSSDTRSAGGTGIGLSLVSEFVQLLDGEVQLVSDGKSGTTFIINIPIHQFKGEAAVNQRKDANTGEAFNVQEESVRIADEKKILVVEDNKELREFIRDCLAQNYLVLECENGEEGLKTALQEIPDIIVSDVMMPKKDGFAMIQEIKNNVFTSHIPCILLTAKSADDSKVHGRKVGADVYITKPFNPEELQYGIKNLLDLKSRILKENPIQQESLDYEDEFMIMLQQKLDADLDNPDLNVDLLTKHLNISRTQLYRKVKALSGKSINQFVRDYRLLQARSLLKTQKYSVSEVCYKVGFSNPSYFSARYKELFGDSPSDLVQ